MSRNGAGAGRPSSPVSATTAFVRWSLRSLGKQKIFWKQIAAGLTLAAKNLFTVWAGAAGGALDPQATEGTLQMAAAMSEMSRE